MKIKVTLAALVLGGCLLPAAVYSADNTKSAVPANVNETPGATIKDNARADPSHRSAHPIDDSVITTKVKAKIVGDKQTRADHVDVETVNGVVDLTGTARSKATAARHVALARQVKGVKSVKNNIQIEPANTAAADDKKSDKPRTAAAGKSDQPVKDTTITTKVKAKFLEDKTVSATDIHVKTVNGVVRLTGSAKSKDESSKAAEIARSVDGVKSVQNSIKIM
jgi:osmotically-inducible protein OsmY